MFIAEIFPVQNKRGCLCTSSPQKIFSKFAHTCSLEFLFPNLAFLAPFFSKGFEPPLPLDEKTLQFESKNDLYYTLYISDTSRGR